MSFIKKFNLSYFKYLILSAMMMILFGLSIVGIEKNEDGVYLIKTSDDLREFAYIVNGTHKNIAQDRKANAILVNDIDIIESGTQERGCLNQLIEYGEADGKDEEEKDEMRRILRNFNFIPIGVEESCSYQGEFDGNGKTITGLYTEINNAYNGSVYSGLFGVIGDEGKVRDIYLKHAYVVSVFNKYEYNLRLSRYIFITDEFKNCTYSGAICGKNNGEIVDCKVFNVISIAKGGITKYKGFIVGENNGKLENCCVEKYEFELKKNEDGVYLIKTSDDLREFANRVDAGETMASAVLLNDIDLSDGDWTPIGFEKRKYMGNFDGNGYTISGIKESCSDGGCVGFFGVVGEFGKIENLIIKDFDFSFGKTEYFREFDIFVGCVAAKVVDGGCLSNCSIEKAKIAVKNIELSISDVHVGGVVGAVLNNNCYDSLSDQIKNCNSYGVDIEVEGLQISKSDVHVGGVVGAVLNNNCYDSLSDQIKNCNSYGVDIEVEGLQISNVSINI
ncbi:MAG: hypothetical protein J6C55_04150, partial [Oscillospiraceae bacterium]|nr:hypothetical protein [Oscillospiraceae bacterium]